MPDGAAVDQLDLAEYLTVARDRFEACVGQLEATVQRVNPVAQIRFTYLRLDELGKPRIRDLARCLSDHLVDYCVSSRRRTRATSNVDRAALHRGARDLLTKRRRSGEAGEILLYLLCECLLRAPQMVAKMGLKTNPRDEVKGSDGIHMRWNEEEAVLEVYFGESKLETSVRKAFEHALASVEAFHSEGMLEFELRLATAHYKWTEGPTKQAVMQFINRESTSANYRVNHACLIGYDWDKYGSIVGEGVEQQMEDLVKHVIKESHRLTELANKKLNAFKLKLLRFEVFFLPFVSVQEFRDTFLREI